jgi:hypothetical protein
LTFAFFAFFFLLPLAFCMSVSFPRIREAVFGLQGSQRIIARASPEILQGATPPCQASSGGLNTPPALGCHGGGRIGSAIHVPPTPFAEPASASRWCPRRDFANRDLDLERVARTVTSSATAVATASCHFSQKSTDTTVAQVHLHRQRRQAERPSCRPLAGRYLLASSERARRRGETPRLTRSRLSQIPPAT